MPNQTPEQIAEGLSEAQKLALISGQWNVDPICADLMMAGCVKRAPTVSWPYYVELTPLGLSVRRALEKMDGGCFSNEGGSNG